MITVACHYFVPEHEGICVVFFTYDISLETISDLIVGDANILFLSPLKPNGTIIYVHVLPNIPSNLEVVY